MPNNNETVTGNIGGAEPPEIDPDADIRVEFAKFHYALLRIRDVVECPAPRYPSMEWYKSVFEHVRRYVAEVIPGDDCG